MRTQVASRLKASHSRPVTSKQAASESHRQGYYCVGGTLVANYITSANPRIPCGDDIAAAIRVLAPSQRYPYSFALRIIGYNDSEDFEKAWDMLDQALAGEPLAEEEGLAHESERPGAA
jgi:hypothetical protein